MLTILFIYFIGKYFYALAENHNQNKWLFAILGVVTYYIGTAVGGVILGFADVFLNLNIDWENDLILILIALPFGILATYVFYYILKKKWEKAVVIVEDDIQDIGKNTDDITE